MLAVAATSALSPPVQAKLWLCCVLVLPGQECLCEVKHCCSSLYSLLIPSSSPLLLFCFHCLSSSSSSSSSLLFFPWWKLSEASPSATVFIYTRLCPLLKAFLCCSTLWALSCLVFPLVTLLALTDSQVKWILWAACCLCVCDLRPASPSIFQLSCAASFLSVVTVTERFMS